VYIGEAMSSQLLTSPLHLLNAWAERTKPGTKQVTRKSERKNDGPHTTITKFDAHDSSSGSSHFLAMLDTPELVRTVQDQTFSYAW
jgi:hypothetical protein